jgi:hypothetical protein
MCWAFFIIGQYLHHRDKKRGVVEVPERLINDNDTEEGHQEGIDIEKAGVIAHVEQR